MPSPLILSEAHWAHDDPLRRTLTERAQRAGVALDPAFEVEFQTAAVEMAAEGVGDALVSYLVTQWRGYPSGLHWASLDPALEEHFAFVTRRSGALSPATRASWRWRSSTSEPYRTWLTPDAASPI